jgi:hypothetical protein
MGLHMCLHSQAVNFLGMSNLMTVMPLVGYERVVRPLSR